MTRKQIEHSILTWKDYAVLVGLAINLLTVGAMYGSLSTTTRRNVEDIKANAAAVEKERELRAEADNSLRSEFSQGDRRLDDRIASLHAPAK